jgi:hypothetical protein
MEGSMAKGGKRRRKVYLNFARVEGLAGGKFQQYISWTQPNKAGRIFRRGH